MASRAFQTLLASSHEASLPHRIVVRVGTAAAWIVAAIYLLAGALTGNDSLFVEAVGPALAGTLMAVQIAVGREDGGLALLGSGLIVAAWSSFFGDEGTMIPAAVALVLTASLGMLFVTQFRALVAATMAVVLFGLPSLWGLSIDEMVVLGAIMALSFVMTHFILGAIQSRSMALNARYQMLFDESPTAVLEEDWSEAVAYVGSEYTGKPERIRQFLMAYPMVVRVAVSKARVLRANEAALSLLGISSPARFLGYRNPNVITEENIDCFISALVSLYEGMPVWEQEVPMRTKTGERQWLLTRSVDTTPMAPATSIVVALADITHMKARSEAMAEMVRVKDEFIANVSHELRTPLTAVVGLTSELAESEGLDDAERAELLQLVVAQAAEMSNIVEDLLVAARAEVGTIAVEIQSVDLIAQARTTLEGLGISAELPDTSPPAVLADPRRLRQILRNLLTNAQRYGGPRRRITAGAFLGRAWLEVRDNGDGIPDEDVGQIFEPYVTGRSGAEGSVGLGLAVARQLAELMGGSLEYERSGAESTFRLELPLADSRQPALASHSDLV